MIEFLFIFLIICIIADFIIRGISAYHKDIKKEAELEKLSNSTVEISLEEVMDFVKGTLETEEDKPLDQLFLKWLDDKDKPNLIDTSSTFVEVDNGKCKGYECSCSPQREDCCKSIDSNNCVLKININRLCGIEDYIKNPDLITRDEAELLAEALNAYTMRKLK